MLSTADVPLADIRRGLANLPPGIEADVRDGQVVSLSDNASPWVTIVADIETWKTVGRIGLEALASFAITEAWKARKRIGSALAAQVQGLIRTIANLRESLPSGTIISLRLSAHDDISSPALALTADDDARLELEMAAFLYHLPALDALMRDEGIDKPGAVATTVFLRLHDDGALEVSWHDRQNRLHSRVLRLPEA